MKKRYEFLLLFAPCLIWWLAIQCLGDHFLAPNRMILAALYTAFGAAAMLTGRKLLGILAVVGGLLLLGSVPVEHEIPDSAISLSQSSHGLFLGIVCLSRRETGSQQGAQPNGASLF